MTAAHKSVVLSAHNVGVSYRRRKGLLRHENFWAIKDVSFDLQAGETLGVIGRNGAGKSTLLSLLAGIIQQNEGDLSFKEGYRASLLSLKAGFIGQLTGRDNIMLSGMLLGMYRADVREKMGDIIEFSELGDFIDQPVYTYSSGMKARLGFSVAMYANPDIVLIDEVLGVGDMSFKKKTSMVFMKMMQSEKSVVLVSHNPKVMRSNCDRVVWLERGRVRSVGTASSVLDEYESSI